MSRWNFFVWYLSVDSFCLVRPFTEMGVHICQNWLPPALSCDSSNIWILRSLHYLLRYQKSGFFFFWMQCLHNVKSQRKFIFIMDSHSHHQKTRALLCWMIAWVSDVSHKCFNVPVTKGRQNWLPNIGFHLLQGKVMPRTFSEETEIPSELNICLSCNRKTFRISCNEFTMAQSQEYS